MSVGKLNQPPSKEYVWKLQKELGIPFQKARNGVPAHEKKTDIELVTDFSEKLLDLYQKRKYFPEDIFNADEVNLQANG